MSELIGKKLVIVEDDTPSLRVYRKWLETTGAEVISLETFEQASNFIKQPPSGFHPDAAITDLVLPDGEGLDIINLWRAKYPDSPILALTAFATVENAVDCMKRGAFDFLRKPVQRDELVINVRKACEHGSLLRENKSLLSAVRVLSMAQTVSSITEMEHLLKTVARQLFRELRLEDCYVFTHTAKKKNLEHIFELRAPGKARRLPEEILDTTLKNWLEFIPEPPENYGNLDTKQSFAPLVFSNIETILVFRSPSGNAAFIVMPATPKISKSQIEFICKNDLGPFLSQAVRTFHTIDVQSALSFIDELTGLYNQRFLEVALTHEIARSSRFGSPVSLLFCDLDKFKTINDTHGHIVGSQIIKESSKIFRDCIRDSDFLLRFGGDEFCVVLPNTTQAGAVVVAERIRTLFENTFFDVREITGVASAFNLNVTSSIGVAAYPEAAETVRCLIQKSDEAMYESKKLGKNRTTEAKGK